MATQYGEDIAVLKDQMKDSKAWQDRMEIKLDLALSTYATKQELRVFKFITIPLTIILTAIITALIAYYFQHNVPTTTVTNSNTTTPASGDTPASSSTTNTTSNTSTTPSSNSGGLLSDPLKQTGL